jgi:hypothetical protein
MLKRLQAAAAASQEAEFERKPENIRSPVVPDSPGDRKKSVASSLIGSISGGGGTAMDEDLRVPRAFIDSFFANRFDAISPINEGPALLDRDPMREEATLFFRSTKD